ncbi:MAG: hypothetical protein M3Y43_04010 [Pseudomonadota bacterium]|nr:hypothetical protein [Pseudomonadota bacterium]
MADFDWRAEEPVTASHAGNRQGVLTMSWEPRGQLWQLLLPEVNDDICGTVEATLGVRPQANRVVFGRTPAGADIGMIWARINQYFVQTAEAMNAVADGLPQNAYLLEQGDGRSLLRLEGPAEPMCEALSHLLPLDLRRASFPPGYAGASEIDLMPVNIWCAPTSSEARHIVFLSVFRSYASSLQHVLTEAGFSIR